MNKKKSTYKLAQILAVLMLVNVGFLAGFANGSEAELKFGYIYLDEEGSNKQQQSFNLYEGAALSLEKLRYDFSNGATLTGAFKNLTMNNRNINSRLFQSNKFSLGVTHSKYRRLYASAPDQYTRRESTDASLWFKPHRYLKLYGGFGQTDKAGEMIDLFEPGNNANITPVDYQYQRYNVGLLANESGRTLQLEYRGAVFESHINTADRRETDRFRAVTMFPIPFAIANLKQVVVNGGFQHFEHRLVATDDTITANGAWGGARVYLKDGVTIRYSFAFDRARSNHDFVATDNISHSLGVNKRWTRSGLSAGYRASIRDDFDNELSGSGFYLSGWAKTSDRLTLKGDYGSESTDVEKGVTLTGDRDQTHYRASAKYRAENYSWYGKLELRDRENPDLGSESIFTRGTLGFNAQDKRYGQVDAALVSAKGEYKNSESEFEFVDYTFSGDALSKDYGKLQLGIGGVYYRSQRDVDIESVSLRLKVNYNLANNWRVEGIYDGRNYDDLQNLNSYYTANIIEINLVKKFSAKED